MPMQHHSLRRHYPDQVRRSAPAAPSQPGRPSSRVWVVAFTLPGPQTASPGVTASRYNTGMTMAEIGDEPAVARPAATTAFGRQMALRADPGVSGRHHVDVDTRWNCPIVPHGGTMAALAAGAMAAEIGDPDQALRSLTTVFAAPVPPGPVEIDVTVLRRGRSMTQATAVTHAPGEAVGHTSVAVFGRDRGGFEFAERTMPAIGPPGEYPSFRDPLPPEALAAGFVDEGPPFAFWENVTGRPVLGHAPWEDYVPASSERGYWYRFDEPPLRSDGTLQPPAVGARSRVLRG